MNKYAGKARIGVIAMLGVAAFAIVGLHRSSGRAYSADSTPAPLFVTDKCSHAVTAYAATSNGDVSPLRPVPTGLAEPEFVAIDPNGNIYATNACNNTITIYAKGSKGDASPSATIGGSDTGLSSPSGIAWDSLGNIYVANYGSNSVTVYPSRANLPSQPNYPNVTPSATIIGSNTGLNHPQGIAVDSTFGNIYVADWGAAGVTVYPPLPSLPSQPGYPNVTPSATISGSNTSLTSPYGIAVDTQRLHICGGLGQLERVGLSAAGKQHRAAQRGPHRHHQRWQHPPIPPDRHRAGFLRQHLCGGLRRPERVYLSFPAQPPQPGRLSQRRPQHLYQREQYRPDLPGRHRGGSSGNIYVADAIAESLFVYSAGNSGNVHPSSATISTTMTTGLSYPQGIALDSSGKIYVADCPACYGEESGAPSVFVYPAGSNGSGAPLTSSAGAAPA